MSKNSIKEKLKNSIIAVLRCKDVNLAKSMAKTMINAGVNAIEVTFTIDNAAELIKELKSQCPNAIIGAGTVLDKHQAELAINNGADFIVCPCIIEEVGQLCKERDVFCSMAGTTATEVYKAYCAGSDVVKLFPGEFLRPSIIKSLKAPFPFIDFMPTGGITHENVKEWFNTGAIAVGAGGYLTKGISEENLDLLEERCKKLIQAAEAV